MSSISVDNNPKTKELTKKLIQCTIRFLHADGFEDYKIDNGYTGDKLNHPYVKLDRTKIKQVVVLNEDGTERSKIIEVPVGNTVAYRFRTQNVRGVVQKVIIIGVVNKTTQINHFIWRDGKEDVISGDKITEHGLFKKIKLIECELNALG